MALALNKSPIAYKSCQPIGSDIQILTHKYTVFFTQGAETWGDEFVLMMWNVWFNWVDIMYESIILDQVYQMRIWTLTGEYMAKILSDVVLKSPITSSWNYKNSDVLNDEWGQPLPLWQGLVNNFNEFLMYFGEQPLPKDWTGIDPPSESEMNKHNRPAPFPKVTSPHELMKGNKKDSL